MTLQQLSAQYTDSAMAIHWRIHELSEAIKTCDDPQEVHRLHRRINDLRPLERQTKEVAKLTAHYYDRRYHPYAQYSL